MGKYKGFTSVELKRPNRSTFDLSHEKRISARIGQLVPVFVSETMPNDTFHGSTEVLVKLAPLIAPIYHRLNLYVHYFFIPNRLLWKDWEPFITGGRLGEAVTTPPVPPRASIPLMLNEGDSILDTGSLADYMGIPPIPDADAALWDNRNLDMMPFAAFYRCWYDYYRDRNYVDDNEMLPMLSGLQAAPIFTELVTPRNSARKRAWEHDYFTSAQTDTQRGAQVLIPMEGSAGSVVSAVTGDPVPISKDLGTGPSVPGDLYSHDISGATNYEAAEIVFQNTEITLNDFRTANALQIWMERNQLAGSRYNESIRAHFGRITSDARLQRAEYLGGGKAVIQISEIMTTAYSEDDASAVVPPGNPAGRGSTYADTNRFSYNCEEHGFIIGILSVMPSSGYMQGIPRMFLQRNTFLDYPWPTFAHLGEQEVYDYEIYADPTSVPEFRVDPPVFGYQSRYSDWKHIPSSSHGDFRTTLDFWHLTRKFGALPTLGEDFVNFEDALQDRVFNVSSVDTLWMYVYNKIHVKRALPYFGTPKLQA